MQLRDVRVTCSRPDGAREMALPLIIFMKAASLMKQPEYVLYAIYAIQVGDQESKLLYKYKTTHLYGINPPEKTLPEMPRPDNSLTDICPPSSSLTVSGKKEARQEQ